MFTAAIRDALGPLARVKRDAEGCEFVPATYGRLEDRGRERDGTQRIYAYTDRSRMISKLRAVADVHPTQIGDREAAFWIPADLVTAIRAVAALLRTKSRKVVSPEVAARLAAYGFKPAQAATSDRETPPGAGK